MRSLLQTLRRICAKHGANASNQYLGRYSIEKLHLLAYYQRTSSSRRVIAVLCLTPLPTFLALVAMDVIPMNNPQAGAPRNSVAFVRSALSHALMTFMTLLPMKQALSLPDREYAFKTIATIAFMTSLTVEAICIPLAFLWRFPLPFREMIGFPVWGMSVTAYNYLLAKKTLSRNWRRLKFYLPIVGVQIVLLYVFLILSIGFAYLSLVPQILVILIFPILKLRLKRLVWKYAQRLDDISTDVTVCLLEISGALFQTVCMQFVTSTALNALVLATDLVQAVHEVHTYMQMDYLGDGKRTLATARKIIESSVHPGAESTTKHSSFQRGKSSHRIAATSVVADGPDRVLRLRPLWWRSHNSENNLGRNPTQSPDDDNSPLGLEGKKPRQLRNIHANSVCITSNAVHFKSSRRLLDLDQAQDELINSNASEALAQSMHATAEATNGLQTPPSVLDQTLEMMPSTGIHREIVPLQRKTLNRRNNSAVVVRLRRAFRVFRQNKSSRERRGYRYTDSPGSSFQNLQALGLHTDSTAQVFPVTSDEVPEHKLHQTKATTHQSEHRTGHNSRRRGIAVMIDGIVIPRRDQARILEQALQLLFACEVLLFAEYMEVVIPFLYALCLGCDWLLPNGQYNLVVRSMSESNVDSMLASSLVYALLELASLLAMYYVMKTKYGVSAFCQLAFVLERYVLTLQGKMVGSFIVIWNAATVHQGTAFGSVNS